MLVFVFFKYKFVNLYVWEFLVRGYGIRSLKFKVNFELDRFYKNFVFF